MDPLRSLPPGFEGWDRAAEELTKRLVGGSVRSWLATLPELSVEPLKSPGEMERAMLLLSYFGHAWVWGERDVGRSIPRGIAAPWHAMAAKLGRPPVLSYASHALNNWRRLDPASPIALCNVVRLMNFYGGLDEEWFVLVHIAIEANAGPALMAGVRLQAAVEDRNERAVIGALHDLAVGTRTLTATLARMTERCDPYIYFKRVRPFIFGWHSNPALPEGMTYEGVEEWQGRPQSFRGETGAQSAIIPALDAVLGLAFSGPAEFTKHLAELRDYIPVNHRAFLAALEAADREAPVRGFIRARARSLPQLAASYDDAILALHEFRGLHLSLANSFIARQQQALPSNPIQTGTGGTPFMAYLAAHAEQTLAHQLSSSRFDEEPSREMPRPGG